MLDRRACCGPLGCHETTGPLACGLFARVAVVKAGLWRFYGLDDDVDGVA